MSSPPSASMASSSSASGADTEASLREQVKQLREDLARQKAEYVQKIRDMEKRHAEDAALSANVDADDVQDAAEFEAQVDMLELSLSDKIDKLAEANTTCQQLRGQLEEKDLAAQALQAEIDERERQLAEQQAIVDHAKRELEANYQLTRQYKASLDKIRAQQETRLAEVKRSHEHEVHLLRERHREEQQKWAAEMLAATESFNKKRDALTAKIHKLQGEVKTKSAQIAELKQRIDYLENADHVAEMLAANRKYKAALAIIEQLKGQIELLNCRVAETEKLLTIEKRKGATLQEQLVTAQRSAQDAIAAAAHATSAKASSSALQKYVGQTVATPRGGARRGISGVGPTAAIKSPSLIRTNAGQSIRIKAMNVQLPQSPDNLRAVHVQSSAAAKPGDQQQQSNTNGIQNSTPLQAIVSTRAEVSFVQNLEQRLQKSRSENVRLVEEVQRLKKQCITLEAAKMTAVNEAIASAQKAAEESRRAVKEMEEAARAAAEEAARQAAEKAEQERKRRDETQHKEAFGEIHNEDALPAKPAASVGVVTMQKPAAVPLASDARAAEAAAAHAQAASEAAAVAKAMIQFRGVQVSGPQTQAALLMPPGLRITGDTAAAEEESINSASYNASEWTAAAKSPRVITFTTRPTRDNPYALVAQSGPPGSLGERPSQLTSPEKAKQTVPRTYVPPATAHPSAARSALATPPGLNVSVASTLAAGIGSMNDSLVARDMQSHDDAEARRRKRHLRLLQLAGAGM